LLTSPPILDSSWLMEAAVYWNVPLSRGSSVSRSRTTKAPFPPPAATVWPSRTIAPFASRVCSREPRGSVAPATTVTVSVERQVRAAAARRAAEQGSETVSRAT
jgi:hypothetical protein